MTGVNPKLLADLARLASRYSADDWETLAAALEDKKRRAQMRALLADMAATSRRRAAPKSSSTPKPERAARLRATLEDIRSKDRDRAALLEDVWAKLRQRELLPTMPMVRGLAEAMGLKGLKATKRDQAITELMEQLVEIPPDDLVRLVQHPPSGERAYGEEYERWARLILRQRGDDRSADVSNPSA